MSWDKQQRERALEAISRLGDRPIKLMEVCGTHTMSIAKAGIKSMLPRNIKLLSGPGCPVCVTPAEQIDQVLELAMRPGVLLASYGDMLRVPGTVPGDSLLRRRALGAQVEIVYSAMDALELAKARPEKEVVFLGVGFETTAPGTGAAALAARDEGIKNFSLYSMLKSVEPALRTLIGLPGFEIDGFICPGHVATIIGAEGFSYLSEDYSLPGVVAGFEAEEILAAVYELARMIKDERPQIKNLYPQAVRAGGNPLARAMTDECFRLERDIWRGLGEIEGSGFKLRDELRDYDAEKKFGLDARPKAKATACRCGDVICGRISPEDCPMFGKRCSPEDPVGPCMVSSGGACAAAYKYGTLV